MASNLKAQLFDRYQLVVTYFCH